MSMLGGEEQFFTFLICRKIHKKRRKSRIATHTEQFNRSYQLCKSDLITPMKFHVSAERGVKPQSIN